MENYRRLEKVMRELQENMLKKLPNSKDSTT